MGLMARFEHPPRCWVPQNVLHTPLFLPAIDIALGPPINFYNTFIFNTLLYRLYFV